MPPTQSAPLSRRRFLKLTLTSATGLAAAWLGGCQPAPAPTALLTPAPSFPPAPSPSLPAPTLPAPAATPPGMENPPIDAFFEDSYKKLLLRDPEGLTINGVSSLYGAANDQLTDLSDAYLRQTQALQKEILSQLRSYPPAALSAGQALSAAIYDWQLEDLVRSIPFAYADYPLTGFVNDVIFNLEQLFSEAQPLNTLADAQAYIGRLGQVKTKCQQLVEGLKLRQAAGVLVPGLLISDFLPRLNAIAAGPAESSLYYAAFSSKIGRIAGLSSQQNQELTGQAQKAVLESVQPGYTILADYFRSIQAQAPQELGLWQFPQGPDYYAYLLRHHTTTDLSAAEIHQLGLEHVERVQGEMRAVFSQLGYPAGDNFSALLGRLYSSTRMISGAAALAAYEAAIARAKGLAALVTDLQPIGQVLVQGGEMGNFLSPVPIDGSRPAIFYANTSAAQPEFQIADIAFHETIPGHHTQTGIARGLKLPTLRRATNFTGYIEGWALYAEKLIWEMGVYEGDPYGNLGRLSMELLRAVRLVADTGIHAKRWTYAQTARYMETNLGYASEIKRYTAMPGQATAYFIGYLKILDLRQQAKDRLGPNFNLKDFHRLVLGSGEMPLGILEKVVMDDLK